MGTLNRYRQTGLLGDRYIYSSQHRQRERGILSVRQASWRVPAGASPVQVRCSSRLVVSVAWWKVTTTAKRTQRLCGVGY